MLERISTRTQHFSFFAVFIRMRQKLLLIGRRDLQICSYTYRPTASNWKTGRRSNFSQPNQTMTQRASETWLHISLVKHKHDSCVACRLLPFVECAHTMQPASEEISPFAIDPPTHRVRLWWTVSCLVLSCSHGKRRNRRFPFLFWSLGKTVCLQKTIYYDKWFVNASGNEQQQHHFHISSTATFSGRSLSLIQLLTHRVIFFFIFFSCVIVHNFIFHIKVGVCVCEGWGERERALVGAYYLDDVLHCTFYIYISLHGSFFVGSRTMFW